MYTRWLATNNAVDLQKIRSAHTEACRLVRAAKNPWFQEKAEEAQRIGGKEVWKCIWAMQCGRRGLVPSRSNNIRDDEVNHCTSLSPQRQQWQKHFTKVLNVMSEFDMTELEKVKQRPVRQDLSEKPSMTELVAALKKLKNGKAGGSSCILPEMVKAGGGRAQFLTFCWTWFTQCGKHRQYPGIGLTRSSFPSLRREI